MFCISLANLRKWVKIPYNLLGVNEDFESERNTKITMLDSFFPPDVDSIDSIYSIESILDNH